MNRRTVKKLASLSAQGAGALTLAADKADASIITTTVNTTVGYSPGSVAAWSSGILPGSASASMFFERSGFGTPNVRSGFRRIDEAPFGGRYVKFGVLTRTSSSNSVSRHLKTFNAGDKLGANPVQTTTVFVGSRVWGTSRFTTTSGTRTSKFHYAAGNKPFTDKFALFTYPGASGPLYGWVELSYTVTDAVGGNLSLGPDLTILEYAIDDSGAQIAAGDTGGGAATPEPSAIYLSGLGALVLGAEGLRRWRATRKPAVSIPAA